MKIDTELLFEGPVVLDPHRFPRVLENLANNAGDAMKPGGVLTVKTWAEDDDLRIEVGDTGHGIEPEVQAHIFEEFYTHGKHRGTGLGLAITHSIVTEHGGTISVESAPGEGTRFLIKIPQP
jgi:signal transduction histidine kinase